MLLVSSVAARPVYSVRMLSLDEGQGFAVLAGLLLAGCSVQPDGPVVPCRGHLCGPLVFAVGLEGAAYEALSRSLAVGPGLSDAVPACQERLLCLVEMLAAGQASAVLD